MAEPHTASDEYRDKLRALDQELSSLPPPPAPKRGWVPLVAGAVMATVIGGVLLGAMAAAGFFDVKAVQGPPGPRGLQGPPGPPGAPGAAAAGGAGVRFAEYGCNAVTCLLTCNEGERIVNVYALSPSGSFVYEDDRSVTFRPVRRPSSKIVLICTPA